MSIFYCDGLFEENDLDFLRKEVDNVRSKQKMVYNLEVASFIYEKCKDKLLEWDPTIKGCFPYITVTKNDTRISKHIDSKKGDERYKVGVYLNDIKKGGTEFFLEGDKLYNVEHKKGRLIMFDINLPHQGEELEKGDIKYMIGIRIN